MYLAAPIILF